MSDADETQADMIERLTAERDYWRDEAQTNARVHQIDRIRRAFGLTPSEAWVLGKLWRSRGATVRRERLDEDLPGKDWEERMHGSNTLQVLIHRIRSKVGRDNITTSHGTGYYISQHLLTRIDGFMK